MAQKVSKEAIDKRQAEIITMAEKLNHMGNDRGEEVHKESLKIQRKAEELNAMVLVYEQQMKAEYSAKYPERPRILKVELTAEQQKSVREKTGVEMEVVTFQDGAEVRTEAMPVEDPDYVEQQAIKVALRSLIEKKGEDKAKTGALEAIAEIRKQDNPELQKELDKLLEDPEFMDGLLAK
jgi:paraquat-inducible protein B